MNMKDLLFFKKHRYFQLPHYLQIEITDYCPLNCPQCYKPDGDFSYMDINLFESILLQAHELGINSIFLNGGEPLLHPDILKMMEIAKGLNIEHTIFTSGCGLDENFINNAHDRWVHINLSFNGSSKDVHSKSRDGFDITLAAANRLKKAGISYQINWVARHDNVYDLPNLIEFGKSYAAHSINIVCNKITSKGEIISALNYDDLLFLTKIIKNNPDYLVVQSCYGQLHALLGAPQNNSLYGCQAGIRLMAINTQGEYMPCTHLYYTEKFNNIVEYWNNSIKLKQLRSDNNLCLDCNFCRFCHSMSKNTHDNLEKGLDDCVVREHILNSINSNRMIE